MQICKVFANEMMNKINIFDKGRNCSTYLDNLQTKDVYKQGIEVILKNPTYTYIIVYYVLFDNGLFVI